MTMNDDDIYVYFIITYISHISLLPVSHAIDGFWNAEEDSRSIDATT